MNTVSLRPSFRRVTREIAWFAAVVFALLVGTATAFAGTHRRIKSAHGPVHVWMPTGYDSATAGVVVYVHGYFTSVDRAWKQHRLAAQFASSGLNALFVACAAPDDWRSPIRWKSLDELLATVEATLDGGLPEGRVVVVGHSGAHRTIEQWLSGDRIDTIILIDALYGEVDAFKAWIEGGPERRLIDAAALTRRWTDELHARLPDTVVFDEFPPTRTGRLVGARSARVVYVRSQFDHMGLVTRGFAIPMLLRAVTLPTVATASRRAPLRVR